MPTFSFTKPIDLTNVRRQGAVAFATIYTGKLIGATGPAPPTAGKGKTKTRPKKFKKIGEVPYKYMSAMSISDKTKGLDEVRFTFSNVLLSDGEELLDLFLEGQHLKIIWGVRGLWHFTRIMQVRTIDTKYGTQTSFTVVANGSGARLQDVEDTKTYNGLRISQIITEVATGAGMRHAVDLKSDPVIAHLSSARRSPMEMLYQLGDKYGFYVRVINNVIFVNEISNGQPARQYDFAGPRGNIVEFSGQSTIAGIRSTSTKVKNREDKSGAATGSRETKPSRSLSIQFKDKGKGYGTKVVTRKSAKPTKPSSQTASDRQKRTTHTLKNGPLAGRVATGKNINRVLKTKKASMVVINEPLVPNINILVGNLNAKYNGRYCTHDITFDFIGGFWKVTAQISRASTNRKPGANKVKKKGAKSPDKRKRKASPNPKITVRYKRDGSYKVKRVGFGVGSRVSSR